MQTHTISLEKAKTNALEEKSIVYTRYITVVAVEKNIKNNQLPLLHQHATELYEICGACVGWGILYK